MSSVSSVTRLFLFVCRSVVEREREREREKENVSKCATKTNHTTSRERGEPIFFFLKRKKASDQTGEEEEPKAGRALLLSPPTNQTQRRQNASGSGDVRLKRESSKTKKRLERSRKFWTLLQNKQLTSFLRTRKRPPFIPILVILKLVTLVFDDDAAEARVDARGRFRLDVLLCCWHFLLFFSDVFPRGKKEEQLIGFRT